ncbi:hypothetical protein QQZ08_010852 [Neonectria magnoliae]|uniref:CCHC-type domain-containing protein n=1 Tax=Neonectria magnoliae TaxID=2732573 RepID=A0ABR1HEW0_9HYPO
MDSNNHMNSGARQGNQNQQGSSTQQQQGGSFQQQQGQQQIAAFAPSIQGDGGQQQVAAFAPGAQGQQQVAAFAPGVQGNEIAHRGPAHLDSNDFAVFADGEETTNAAAYVQKESGTHRGQTWAINFRRQEEPVIYIGESDFKKPRVKQMTCDLTNFFPPGVNPADLNKPSPIPPRATGFAVIAGGRPGGQPPQVSFPAQQAPQRLSRNQRRAERRALAKIEEWRREGTHGLSQLQPLPVVQQSLPSMQQQPVPSTELQTRMEVEQPETDCAHPSVDGYVHGCPVCNDRGHTVAKCPKGQPAGWEALYWGVTRRANRPALAGYWDWMELVRVLADEKPPDGYAIPKRFPWRSSFVLSMVEYSEHPWLAFDYAKNDPAYMQARDELTCHLKAVKQNYARIYNEAEEPHGMAVLIEEPDEVANPPKHVDPLKDRNADGDKVAWVDPEPTENPPRQDEQMDLDLDIEHDEEDDTAF